jgi:hypothetical protein
LTGGQRIPDGAIGQSLRSARKLLQAPLFSQDASGNKKSHWLEIGSAWAHKKDGKGFDIQLDALPVNGRVVLRLREDKPKQAE